MTTNDVMREEMMDWARAILSMLYLLGCAVAGYVLARLLNDLGL